MSDYITGIRYLSRSLGDDLSSIPAKSIYNSSAGVSANKAEVVMARHFSSPRPLAKDTQEARWMNCVMVTLQNTFSVSGKPAEAEVMSDIMQNFMDKARSPEPYRGIRLDIDKLKRAFPGQDNPVVAAFMSKDYPKIDKILTGVKPGTQRKGATMDGVKAFLSQCGAKPEDIIPGLNIHKTFEVLDAGKPLIIRDKKLVPMGAKLCPERFPKEPISGHVYLVYKGPDSRYYVADSNLSRQVEISRELLEKELQSDNRTAVIINHPPNIPPFLK